MQTYELLVEGRAVRANCSDRTLVRTSIGIDQVHVMFDNAEWLGFPITVTFAQSGVDPVTQSLTVSEITDSSEWVAEATVTVPYEVITMVGPIRVTFQGTDSDGRHIITAKGSPLSVEEAGDVDEGSMPEDAPSVDQWTQAYADAQAIINEAAGLITNLQSQLDSLVATASTALDERIEESYVPATKSSLGVVQIGDGLSVTSEGIVSTTETNGITAEQSSQIANLAALAYYCFDTTFDDDGNLEESAMIKSSAVPIDGTTLTTDDDGNLTVALIEADEVSY